MLWLYSKNQKKKKKKLEIKHGIEDQTSTIRSSQSQVNAALQLLI